MTFFIISHWILYHRIEFVSKLLRNGIWKINVSNVSKYCEDEAGSYTHCHMMARVDLRTETLHLVVCLDACGDCWLLSGAATTGAQGRTFYSANIQDTPLGQHTRDGDLKIDLKLDFLCNLSLKSHPCPSRKKYKYLQDTDDRYPC